jgi:hypothetical protein
VANKPSLFSKRLAVSNQANISNLVMRLNIKLFSGSDAKDNQLLKEKYFSITLFLF